MLYRGLGHTEEARPWREFGIPDARPGSRWPWPPMVATAYDAEARWAAADGTPGATVPTIIPNRWPFPVGAFASQPVQDNCCEQLPSRAPQGPWHRWTVYLAFSFDTRQQPGHGPRSCALWLAGWKRFLILRQCNAPPFCCRRRYVPKHGPRLKWRIALRNTYDGEGCREARTEPQAHLHAGLCSMNSPLYVRRSVSPHARSSEELWLSPDCHRTGYTSAPYDSRRCGEDVGDSVWDAKCLKRLTSLNRPQ